MPRPRKTRELTIPDSIKSIQPLEFTAQGKAVYSDNPFITADKFAVLVANKSQVVGQDLTITDKKADEIASGVVVRTKIVDTEQFVKIYSDKAGFLFDLTATARKAMIAVVLAVQDQSKDKAEIYLSYQQAIKYYNLINYEKIPSKIMFSRGINQLIDAEFLANHWRKNGWYWTNPNIIFNGDRIAFMDLIVRDRKKEQEHLPQAPAQQSLIERKNPYIEN